jgi:oligopeptide/dipeptide ABC transporter ATP-binding protein
MTASTSSSVCMPVQKHEKPLLNVRDLTVKFHTTRGLVTSVDRINFTLDRGKVLGLVGESGSGKSVTALSLLRLIPKDTAEISNGEIWFDNQNLVTLPEKDLREVRGRDIGMIFQDPMTSLNPIASIGSQVTEPLKSHLGMTRAQSSRRAEELLELVGIREAKKRLAQYPHELSGGMRQRVMIAMAIACEPKLIIADEPTTALDVTTQAQILDLLQKLRTDLGVSIILITHDLGVVAEFADDVQVMYAGRAVERSSVQKIFEQPAHPYSDGLLKSIPSFDSEVERLVSIEGTVPSPFALPPGCAFAPRCAHVRSACTAEVPSFRKISADRHAACLFPLAGSGVGL